MSPSSPKGKSCTASGAISKMFLKSKKPRFFVPKRAAFAQLPCTRSTSPSVRTAPADRGYTIMASTMIAQTFDHAWCTSRANASGNPSTKVFMRARPPTSRCERLTPYPMWLRPSACKAGVRLSKSCKPSTTVSKVAKNFKLCALSLGVRYERTSGSSLKVNNCSASGASVKRLLKNVRPSVSAPRSAACCQVSRTRRISSSESRCLESALG
mmetsp:Transcript_53348/g.147781  ORF Transcript_53348/g.147781 Transcript_53348/m.147781 type:complete len:212 (+) Transcript_53348:547-1182(+)